jgi:hypothetical protein
MSTCLYHQNFKYIVSKRPYYYCLWFRYLLELINVRYQLKIKWLKCSVPDSWRFDTDTDLRIRNTSLWIRIMIFSTVAVKMLTKNNLFPSFLLISLKGPYHEIDFENVDENWQILALLRAEAGFWIFQRHLWFLVEIKHLHSGRC